MVYLFWQQKAGLLLICGIQSELLTYGTNFRTTACRMLLLTSIILWVFYCHYSAAITNDLTTSRFVTNIKDLQKQECPNNWLQNSIIFEIVHISVQYLHDVSVPSLM